MSEPGDPQRRVGEAPHEEVARVVRTGRIIVLAMAMGISLFTVVAAVLVAGDLVGGRIGPPDGGGSGGLLDREWTPLLLGVGAALLVMLFTAPLVRRAVWESGSPATAQLPGRWLTALIVASGIREGVGLLGIALGLLAESVPFVVGAGAATVAAFLIAFPRGEELDAAVRRSGGMVSRPPPSGPTSPRPR